VRRLFAMAAAPRPVRGRPAKTRMLHKLWIVSPEWLAEQTAEAAAACPEHVRKQRLVAERLHLASAKRRSQRSDVGHVTWLNCLLKERDDERIRCRQRRRSARLELSSAVARSVDEAACVCVPRGKGLRWSTSPLHFHPPLSDAHFYAPTVPLRRRHSLASSVGQSQVPPPPRPLGA